MGILQLSVDKSLISQDFQSGSIGQSGLGGLGDHSGQGDPGGKGDKGGPGGQGCPGLTRWAAWSR